MAVVTVEDWHRFQSDLDHLNKWSPVSRFDSYMEKYKLTWFGRNMRPIQFDYRIGGSALERVD
jgi:hypothetical protein